VQTLPATIHGQGDLFGATQWSVILAAGSSRLDTESSDAALAQLCHAYWPPLYTYVRARGYSRHDAQDLTQGFFAYAIEHKIYARTDPAKGKFRSFLLASLKNFLADARDRAQTLKRGGGQVFIPLDESKAETAEWLLQTYSGAVAVAPDEDRLFERSWAETLVNTALEQLAAAYNAEGKQGLFSRLRCFVAAGSAPLPTYAELATQLGQRESSVRSHVTRIRARYREMLRAEVRRSVATEADVDGELRELLRVLTQVP
jgi:RNA polymerase sigma-70 factor (ECF subfamily)